MGCFDMSQNHDKGLAELARLALRQTDIAVRDPRSSARRLILALEPLYAVNWTGKVLSIIGPQKIRELLCRLRNSNLGQENYMKIKAHLTRSVILPDTITPREWGIWTDLINRYNLYETDSLEAWADWTLRLQASRVWNPADLSSLTKEEIFALDDDREAKGRLILLWQAAQCFFEYRQQDHLPLRVDLINKDVDALLKKFQCHKLSDTEIYKDYGRLRDQANLPSNFDDLSPSGRTQAIALAMAEGADCRTFLMAAEKLNTLRSAQGSLQSVASGIRSYVRYCAVMNWTPFPPTEASVRSWSSIFKPNRTFKNYIAHLKKACYLLDLDTKWDTPAIRTIAAGLENSQDRSFAFPNFFFSKDLLRLLDREGVESQFFQLGFLSYLFSLRVPSETLCLKRAFFDDPLTEFVPQTDKALAGIRRHSDRDVLVLKFSFRKNIRGGCVLLRPCLCDEIHDRARTLCPVHSIWPLIRARVNAGDLLFPSFSPCNLNRTFKMVMTKLGYPDGPKYSSHAFRRGATQEIKDCGSTLALIIKSGTWTHSGYKAYLGLQADFAINISRLVLDALGSGSEDDDPDHPANEKRMRKKMKGIPVAFVDERVS